MYVREEDNRDIPIRTTATAPRRDREGRMIYQDRCRKLLRQGAIGYVLGLALFFVLMIEAGKLSAVFGWLAMGLLTAGIPFGWELTGRLLKRTVLVGTIPMQIIGFVLRVFAAYLAGLFLYPLTLICCLVRGYVCK